MKKKYRIVPNKVTKNYAVECWRWYFPFWTQVAFWRSFETIDEVNHSLIWLGIPSIIN